MHYVAMYGAFAWLAAFPSRLLEQRPVQHQLGYSFSCCQVYG